MLSVVALGATVQAGVFDVRDFGAKGDGVTKDTAAIQRAIDAASAVGGGTVTVPNARNAQRASMRAVSASTEQSTATAGAE